ncbi:protein lifeguard 2-like isoform X2 [Dendropsophus ebraccatus]|uniref:protein lifeguard 2-like isoform X2 n=1 Tax=Dendropsophus ebraccatus TaxID=150705 RepID=UPI00383140E6
MPSLLMMGPNQTWKFRQITQLRYRIPTHSPKVQSEEDCLRLDTTVTSDWLSGVVPMGMKHDRNQEEAVMSVDRCLQGIRVAFIRKVYMTLTVQLVITFGLVFMFTFWKTLRSWTRQNPYLLYALIPSTFVLIMVLACCDSARRRVPLNFILLAIFTVFEGCLLGSFAAYFDADAVMWATGATILVTLGLTLFAFQTKWDFTVMSGGLMVALLVLLSFGILAAIFRSMWLNIVYACLGTLIFGMYLVVDTQLILGKGHRYSVSPEEYIFAALNLYLDVINLFLLLLQLFGLCN